MNAARQAMTSISEQPLSAALVFASVCYNLEALLEGIHNVVGETTVLGTTTAGEICNDSQQNSVVVLVLASCHLSVRAGVGTAVSGDWREAVSQAVSAPQMQPFFSPEEDAIWSELTRQGRSAFGLLFSPGNTRHADSRSYEILEELKRLSGGRLPIFGGSAADDWRMEENDVLLGRRAYPDSVLVAVFETRLRFGIALAHGFQPGSRRAVVTRGRGHEVLELDGQPGAEVYAEMLGASREALEGKHLTLTARRPAGSPDPYGQYSINVASYFTPQGGVRFTQPVPEGTSLAIMEANPDHMIDAGQEALRKALLRSGTAAPAVVLCFSCALRSLILGERMREEIAGIQEMVPGVPVVGFYSFGEQGLADDGVNRHNNEVIAVLVLGQELSYASQVAVENEGLRESLSRSEKRFRSLFSSAGDAIFIHDLEGHFLEVNPEACDRLGYSREELLDMTPMDIDTPEFAALVRARVKKMLSEDRILVETAHERRDGTVIPIELSSRVIEYEGEPAIISIARDITARKRAEEALRRAHDELEVRVRDRTAELESANRALQTEVTERERAAQGLQVSEERLSLALEATSEGLWENNFGEKPDYFSGRMYTMLGYEPVDPVKGFQFFRSLLHPDDLGRFELACRRLDEPGNDDYAIEFRLKAKDGSWRHVLSRGKCIERDDVGRAVRVLGTHTDITDRVRLEEAYRTSVEHSLQGLAILQRGRVVFANPAIARLTGYTVEELLSSSPEEIKAAVHAEDRERVWKMREEYLTGKAAPARHEFRLMRRDGAVRWVEALTSRITYRGEPALQISYMDITERKKAEETVRRSLEETSRSRRLLLTLSRAAQAVERAHTIDEVNRVVAEQVSALGYQATIFDLSDDRTHLVVSHLTFDSAVLRAAERLTGLSAQGYRFPLTPGGVHQRVIASGKTVFTCDDHQPFLDALPKPIRPLVGRLVDLLGMEQSIVAPLMVGGRAHGVLAVTGDGLTEADVPAIAGFANQAAIAIENARLVDRITQHERELQKLSTRLIRAQEEERGRISRELHDEIGQALTAMSINLTEVEKRLPVELAPAVRERLAETAALADQTSEQISAMALDLRPSLLDDLGLVPALRWYVSRYTQRLGIEVHVEAVDLETRLDPEVETALYRVMQEALTNVARHAQATSVHLRLERKASSVVATIKDNGQGFDTVELADRQAPERGAGLLGMRERVTLLGGHFRVESVPGGGTELLVEIPLRWGARS
jgi:PAS domain S-box-containing protein